MRTLTIPELLAKARQSLAYKVEGFVIDFTEQVVARMEMLGLKRNQFAAKIGSSPAYVTKMLSGGTNFTAESMIKAADALNADLRVELIPRVTPQDWAALLKQEPVNANRGFSVWESGKIMQQETPDSSYPVGSRLFDWPELVQEPI